jgi:hypothetical protein
MSVDDLQMKLGRTTSSNAKVMKNLGNPSPTISAINKAIITNGALAGRQMKNSTNNSDLHQ